MENILVAFDSRHGAWEAFSRACALAARMEVRLNVLLVMRGDGPKLPRAEVEAEECVRKRLEQLIEAAKAEGFKINYFVAEGNYEDQVIDFVNHNKISLLVYELTEGDARSADKDFATLRSIRHRISCRVEVVAPRKTYS